MVAGPKLAGYFKPGVSAGEALAAFKAKRARPRRLATQPAGSVPNTTLQHWLWEVAKAEKEDAEVVPMGIDATQQALLTGAVEGATIREPAVTIVTSATRRIKIVALGGEMFPNQPGTVVALSAHRDEGSQAVADHRRPRGEGRGPDQGGPRPGCPAYRGGAGQGHRRHRHDQGGARPRRPASSWRTPTASSRRPG